MGRKKNNLGLNNKNQEMGYPVILIVILIYIYVRNYIISRVGISGAGYFFTSLDFVAIFICFIPYGLMHVVSAYIKSRLKSGQLPNAKRFMYGGFVIAFLYSSIIILLLFVFRKIISGAILLGTPSTYILPILSVSIIFMSFSSVYKAYFLGSKNHGTLLILELLEKMLLVAGVIIFCNAFINYGNKASLVLLNEEIRYSFGVIGCSIGLLVSSFVTLLAASFMFSFYKRTLVDSSYSGKYDDIYDILTVLTRDLFKNSLPVSLSVLSLDGILTVYLMYLKADVSTPVLSYNVGIYAGIFFTIILAPVLWLVIYIINEKRDINIAMKSGDTAEIRIKMTDVIKYAMMIGIGFAIFAEIEARNIIQGLMLVESDKAVVISRFGIPAVVMIGLSVVFVGFLQAVKKHMSAISNSIISLGLALFASVLFIRVLKLGVYGAIISLYLFGMIFAFLNAKSLKKYIKRKAELFRSNTSILLSFTISGIITFVITLVLNMFLLPILIVIITGVVYLIVSFVLLAKFSVINSYNVMKYPLSDFFYKLGNIFRLF